MVHLLLSRELIYCYARVTPIGLHLVCGQVLFLSAKAQNTLMFSARLPAGHLDYGRAAQKLYLTRRDSHFGNQNKRP